MGSQCSALNLEIRRIPLIPASSQGCWLCIFGLPKDFCLLSQGPQLNCPTRGRGVLAPQGQRGNFQPKLTISPGPDTLEELQLCAHPIFPGVFPFYHRFGHAKRWLLLQLNRNQSEPKEKGKKRDLKLKISGLHFLNKWSLCLHAWGWGGESKAGAEGLLQKVPHRILHSFPQHHK